MTANIRLVHGIKVLKSKHATVKALRKQDEQPSLYGHQVWQSSYMVMDYLHQNPLATDLRVMDIGCGWGLLGIFCAKHFASRALLVDADSEVFAYVNSHEKLNNVSVETAQARFNQLDHDDFAAQDVVLGSDICFWPELSTQLRNLVTTAMAARVGKIILADPGRRTFLQLAEFCKANFSCQLHPWKLAGRTASTGYVLVIENTRNAA